MPISPSSPDCAAFPPRVGAVIPARNRFAKTARFLACMAAQTYSNLRIYVTDANSSDQTADYVGVLADNVTLLTAGDEDYWSAATNIAVVRALADGCDYILTINDDAVVGPDFIARMVAAATRHNAPILAARIDYLQEMGRVWAAGAYNNWGGYQLFYLRHHQAWEDDIPELCDGSETATVTQTPGDGVLIHRQVFEAIGVYDAVHCPHQHGDSEFILRARTHGFVCQVALQIVLYNDADNDSGRNEAVLTPPDQAPCSPGWLRDLWRRFWSAPSPNRIPTIAYIVNRYAPCGVRLKTLILYYAACVWFIYLRPRLPTRLAALAARLRRNGVRVRSRLCWVYPLAALRYWLARRKSRRAQAGLVQLQRRLNAWADER